MANEARTPWPELIKTIEIKNKEGRVVERKEVVTVKGLLHLAHAERLSAIHTRLVQSPTKDNGETAIALVRVHTARGSFSGLGDANPRNVTARVALHFIRMAETRALARALRAALDIGAVAIEELEEEFGFADARSEVPRGNGHRTETSRTDDPPREDARPNGRPSYRGNDRGGGSFDGPMSDPQRRLLYRLAFEHGHEGDEARAWLHQELGVESLSEATKRAASSLIDRLVRKDDGNGHAAEAG
ncbi:MAG: hypothetical protein M5U28_21170 [Sandaracinaceae bacterium]|nr:hypothetical protein [Sandaracinaceae bacterium]